MPSSIVCLWSRLPIARRITIGFVAVIAVCLGSTVGAWRLADEVGDSSAMIRVDCVPGTVSMANANIQMLRAHLRLFAAVGAAGVDPAAYQEQLKHGQKNLDNAASELAAYDATITQVSDRVDFDKLNALQSGYLEHRKSYLSLVETGRAAEAAALSKEKLEPTFAELRYKFETMLKWNADNAIRVTGEIDSDITRLKAVLFWSLIGCAVFAALFGTLIITGINRVLRRITQSLHDGALATAEASSQVSAASQTLASGTEEQTQSIDETTTTIHELFKTEQQNANNSRTAREAANQARALLEAGADDMRRLREAMTFAQQSAAETAKIVKTIDEIAFQTNILALNAAVEAARAGESGAGFAVVADEVRNLAQRAAAAAKETAAKIEDSNTRTRQGASLSEAASQKLDTILQQTRQLDGLVGEIAAAAESHQSRSQATSAALDEIGRVTRSNASAAEECASSAEELHAQAEVLHKHVIDLTKIVEGDRHQDRELRAAAEHEHAIIRTKHLAPATPAPRRLAAPAVTRHATQREHADAVCSRY